jgi:hypothetical protein
MGKIVSGLKPKFVRMEKQFQQSFSVALKRNLTSQAAVDVLTKRTMKRIGELAPMFDGVDDPTNPDLAEWHEAIRGEITRNLQVAASNVPSSVPASFVLDIELLSNEFVGIDTDGPSDREDPSPMRWLYFFIVTGFDSDLYWLPGDLVSKYSSGDYTGRFKKGYLVSKKRAESINKMEKSKVVLLHPQSGKPPSLSLDGILTPELVNSLFIVPARREALATLSLK